MATEETRTEPRIEPVTGREAIHSGMDVKIRGGETESISFKGMRGRAIRNEEVRDNSESGKREQMVIVKPYLPDGSLGTPFDLPRRYLKGPRDESGFSKFVGKLVGIIRGGKYVRVPAGVPEEAQ